MQRSLNCCVKHFACYVTAVIFILITTPVNADNSLYKQSISTKKPGLQGNDEPRMFLIGVIDSEDTTIGVRCNTDLDGVIDEFEYVAGVIGAHWIDPKIIKGGRFSKEAVNDAIDNWLGDQQLTADDIVIFYYSGHGFRFRSDASAYPRMWLKTAANQNVETTNLRIEEDIYNRIVKMGAGVNIVISDCCNNTYAGATANFDNVTVPAHKRDHSGKKETGNTGNGHALFIPGEPLSILVTAAGKGELAGGKADDGGFFTAFFLDALNEAIDDTSEEATWENIFKDANKNAAYFARSAACPEYKHDEQGRCVQTAEIRIKGSN